MVPETDIIPGPRNAHTEPATNSVAVATASRREKNKSRPQVFAKIRSIESLTALEVERMYQLMQLYYENVEPEQFKADLLEKDDVILLHDKEFKTIQGFSTILKVPMTVNNKQLIGVYSGDTVLNKAYWGTAALGITFLRYLWQVKVANLSKPIYWFLISKGYKTYLIMANNFPTHYPRYEQETPGRLKAIMNSFYSKKFGGNYIPHEDLIHFDKPSAHLRENIAALTEEQLRLPRVKFFQEKNPQWNKGDELTCIAEMTLFMPLFYSIKKMIKGFLR